MTRFRKMWGKSVPGRGDSKDKGQVWPFEEQQEAGAAGTVTEGEGED